MTFVYPKVKQRYREQNGTAKEPTCDYIMRTYAGTCDQSGCFDSPIRDEESLQGCRAKYRWCPGPSDTFADLKTAAPIRQEAHSPFWAFSPAAKNV